MKKLTAFFIIAAWSIYLLSCSRTGGIPPPPPPDPCLSVSINISGTVTNPSAIGASDGGITVTVTGGTRFTYSINGGAMQSSGNFSNLPAGSYTVMAKSNEGCSASVQFLVTNPAPSCTSVSISVSPTATSNIPCEANNASLVVTAAGGTAPYTYSLDGAVYQPGNHFYNLASGSHTVAAKDVNGCVGVAAFTVSNLPLGTLFQQVKSIIQNRCLYCHNTATASGGVSYSTDCNIVNGKLRIKVRAVDGLPSPMPQTGLIPAAERQKIMDWINAGGRFSD